MEYLSIKGCCHDSKTTCFTWIIHMSTSHLTQAHNISIIIREKNKIEYIYAAKELHVLFCSTCVANPTRLLNITRAIYAAKVAWLIPFLPCSLCCRARPDATCIVSEIMWLFHFNEPDSITHKSEGRKRCMAMWLPDPNHLLSF